MAPKDVVKDLDKFYILTCFGRTKEWYPAFLEINISRRLGRKMMMKGGRKEAEEKQER